MLMVAMEKDMEPKLVDVRRYLLTLNGKHVLQRVGQDAKKFAAMGEF